MWKPAARKSASTPGQVGDDGMKPKKRGWSSRAAYGSTSRAACSSTSRAGRPPSGGGFRNCSSRTCRNSPSQAPPSPTPSIRSTSSCVARSASSTMASRLIRRLPLRAQPRLESRGRSRHADHSDPGGRLRYRIRRHRPALRREAEGGRIPLAHGVDRPARAGHSRICRARAVRPAHAASRQGDECTGEARCRHGGGHAQAAGPFRDAGRVRGPTVGEAGVCAPRDGQPRTLRADDAASGGRRRRLRTRVSARTRGATLGFPLSLRARSTSPRWPVP